jgi:glutathione S-transferase
MFAQFGDELGNPMKKRGYDAVVRRIEDALAKGPFVMGETFTGADLLVASALAFGRQAFPESAAIDAYLERCKERPANARAINLDDAEGVQNAA